MFLYNLTVTNTKCTLYFVKGIVGQIIDQLDKTGACPTVNEDGTVEVTAAEDTNGYLCSAPDDYGTSYYYRGNVINNYVMFGTNEQGQDMYWRIIRINGDGSIRMIYDGTSAHANGDGSTDRQVGESSYAKANEIGFPGEFINKIGYMYGDILGSTFEDVHANTNDSTIKTYLDNWYKTNIEDKGLSSYISDTLFCNDRSFASLNTGSGTGEDPTYYRWYYGPWDTSHVQYPKYNCSNLNDRFTVDDEEIGNGDLSYPIARKQRRAISLEKCSSLL